MARFDMTRAWRDAMAMVKANREVLLIIAGIFFFFPSLAAALLVPGMQEALVNEPDFNRAVANVYENYWWLILLVALAQAVGILALLALLRDGANPTVGEAMSVGLAALAPYILAYLLFVIGITVLFLVLVGIPAATGIGVLAALGGVAAIALVVYAWVRTSLVSPVIAIEKVRNPVTALQRSWNLTRHSALRLFTFFALIAIVYFVVSLVVGIVLSAISLIFGAALGLVVDSLVTSLLGAAVTVILVAVLAAAHRQLTGTAPEEVEDGE